MILSVSASYCGTHIESIVKSASSGSVKSMYGLYLPKRVTFFSMDCPMTGSRSMLMSEPAIQMR